MRSCVRTEKIGTVVEIGSTDASRIAESASAGHVVESVSTGIDHAVVTGDTRRGREVETESISTGHEVATENAKEDRQVAKEDTKIGREAVKGDTRLERLVKKEVTKICHAVVKRRPNTLEMILVIKVTSQIRLTRRFVAASRRRPVEVLPRIKGQLINRTKSPPTSVGLLEIRVVVFQAIQIGYDLTEGDLISAFLKGSPHARASQVKTQVMSHPPRKKPVAVTNTKQGGAPIRMNTFLAAINILN